MKKANIVLIVLSASVLSQGAQAGIVSSMISACKQHMGEISLDVFSLDPKARSQNQAFKTATDLGFQDADGKVVRRISQEVESYFKKTPLNFLASLAGGRNPIDGRSRGNSEAYKILEDNRTTEKQKRALLKDLYFNNVYKTPSEHAILDGIRHKNNIQNEVGGFGNLWIGTYQYLLQEAPSLEEFSKISSSFDGLLYLPGPDINSVTVYGATHFSENPVEYISHANNGQPVEISDLQIYQQKQSTNNGAYALKFSAVIRKVEPGTMAKPGSQIIQESVKPISFIGQFLVEPYQMDRETIALTKKKDGQYSLYFRVGYRHETRLNSGSTPTFKDLSTAVTHAQRLAGLSEKDITRKYDSADSTEISLSANVDSISRARFESELITRINALKNLSEARSFRISPFADGVTEEVALKAEISGFTSKAEVKKALGDGNFDGGSTYDQSYHPDWPRLSEGFKKEAGVFTLEIDDRIHHTGNRWASREIMSAFADARKNQMTAVSLPSGAYVVHSSERQAFWWSGFYEDYHLFSNLERAQEFIRTHRFIIEDRPF